MKKNKTAVVILFKIPIAITCQNIRLKFVKTAPEIANVVLTQEHG